jgi:DNA-binding transcriptional MerR regulator
MAHRPGPELTIAELAAHADVTPRTIRYYVAEGLLPPPRGSGQRRIYGPEHLDRLKAIRQLKAAYLPLGQIRRRLAEAGQPALARALKDSAVTPGINMSPGGPVRSESGPTGVAGLVAEATSPAAHSPLALGGQAGLGRIEIYAPTESVWHRQLLAPGIELHYQDTADPKLAAAIERLIREAASILDAPDHPGANTSSRATREAG